MAKKMESNKIFFYYTLDNNPGEGLAFSSLGKARAYHARCMKTLDCTSCFDKDNKEASFERGCICHLKWEKYWNGWTTGYFRIAEIGLDK
jgi:hypothetical protein